MSKLVTLPSTAVPAMTEEQVNLIKRTICKDATDDELQLFLYQCKRTGLDPLARQIFFQKFKNRTTGETTVTIITGVDGYRAIADRTGCYAGSDDPVFDDENQPKKATVTVYKIVGGTRCPFTASARWDQYYPGDGNKGFMWRKMPHLMLGKCAEGLALRKAFPVELSSVYVREEMEQASNDVITAEEVYTGTSQQNEQIKAWCAAHNVAQECKAKIKDEIQGKTMSEVESIVSKYAEF